jgi:hypothetical protein
VGQEHLIELALELRREVARGPAPPDLLVDLVTDGVEVSPGLVVVVGRRFTGSTRVAGQGVTSSVQWPGLRHR